MFFRIVRLKLYKILSILISSLIALIPIESYAVKDPLGAENLDPNIKASTKKAARAARKAARDAARAAEEAAEERINAARLARIAKLNKETLKKQQSVNDEQNLLSRSSSAVASPLSAVASPLIAEVAPEAPAIEVRKTTRAIEREARKAARAIEREATEAEESRFNAARIAAVEKQKKRTFAKKEENAGLLVQVQALASVHNSMNQNSSIHVGPPRDSMFEQIRRHSVSAEPKTMEEKNNGRKARSNSRTR